MTCRRRYPSWWAKAHHPRLLFSVISKDVDADLRRHDGVGYRSRVGTSGRWYQTVTRCTAPSVPGMAHSGHTRDAEEDFVLTTARDRISTYQWGNYQIEHHHCAICGCGTWSRSPLWDQEAKRAAPGKFRVQVNAWLLNDFDPNAQPIEVIDGKNLW